MKNIKFPIFIKLLLVISFLLTAVSIFTSSRTSNYFENISLKREEEINLRFAEKSSDAFDRLMQSIYDKTIFYSQFLMQSTSEDLNNKANSIQNDSDIIALNIYSSKDLKTQLRSTLRADFIKKYKLSDDYFSKFNNELPLHNIVKGEIKIQSVTHNNVPLIWLGIPIKRDSMQQVSFIASIFIRQESLQKAYQDNGSYNIYVLDQNGKTLAHPIESYVLEAHDFSQDTFYKEALKSEIHSAQKFVNIDNKRHLKAYSKSKFGAIIISSIDESSYTEPIEFVKKQSYYILAIVLFLSISIITIFSNSLTFPIEKLLIFTKEISKGNFDLEIAKNVTSNDEVGSLAIAFDDMTVGLKERDKMKNVMDKFHGAAIADDMMSGEVDLRGSSKDVTVFFSDIRSFTKYSESRSAEEVVSMLNEYMDVMVKCIYKHNGVVDKFVGDAIMAVWGVPNSSEHDVENAVNACLDMRVELNKLNEKRIARGEDPIMIGMGLNSGQVISGTVGSEDRMEYTVIGDTVNTAARIEASTKAFGTDLLISGSVFEAVKDKYIFTQAGKVAAKGKSTHLELIKVEGVIKDGQHIILKTPYSHFEAEDEEGGKTQRVA